jgi:hypothetical protein
MRLLIAILWLAGFFTGLGCGIAAAENVPLPRPRPPIWAEPHSFREAIAGLDFNSADVTSEPSDCRKRLETIAAIEPMPRLIGPGVCGGGDMVRLDAVLLAGNARVAIKPAPYLRCGMAESLASWVRDEAAPRVSTAGMALRVVNTYDDYECRGRNRVVGAIISEHGKGNAVDVRAFTFADGQVMELTDMTAPKDLRESLRESACHRFTTVLGPGSDSYHNSHIHLDDAERHNGYRICQWDVREPPPPLPPSKPVEAAAPAEVASAPATNTTTTTTKSPDVSPAAVEPVAPANNGGIIIADAAVPLPTPRPANADKIPHGGRKILQPFHLPFTLWR